jgi:peptide/nickel transport system ATP-binding protein
MALLFITHDLGIVEEIADKVIVMHKGEIKEFGTTKELMKDPAHPYTKALLACRSTSFQKGQILPTVESIMKGEDNTKPSIKQAHSSPILPAFSQTEKQPFLQVKNLSVTLSEKKWWSRKKDIQKSILRGVSFDLFQGETVGLVGESGCGKTTLGRTLLQLQPASNGRIEYKGTNLISLSRRQFNPYRKEMQIVFQDPYASLNPRMRIGQILLEPLQLHQRHLSLREAQKTILQLLEKVGLPPDAIHRFPHAFSGGQRQRICIARALAVNPSFIVWDESVSALDASIQAQILNLINQLKKEWGFSSLFISHDLSVVKYLCDRILVMKNGEIVEQGDPKTIWENPSHPYTKELLAAIPGKK